MQDETHSHTIPYLRRLTGVAECDNMVPRSTVLHKHLRIATVVWIISKELTSQFACQCHHAET